MYWFSKFAFKFNSNHYVTDCTFKTNNAAKFGGAVASLGGNVTDTRSVYEVGL
jgi:predicted outer membrane repeat protein